MIIRFRKIARIVANQNRWQKGKWNFCQATTAGFKVQSQKTRTLYGSFLVLTWREIWSSVWRVGKLGSRVIDGAAEPYSCDTSEEAVLSQQHYTVPFFEKSHIYVVTRWREVNNPENLILRIQALVSGLLENPLWNTTDQKHQALFMVFWTLNIQWRKPRRYVTVLEDKFTLRTLYEKTINVWWRTYLKICPKSYTKNPSKNSEPMLHKKFLNL